MIAPEHMTDELHENIGREFQRKKDEEMRKSREKEPTQPEGELQPDGTVKYPDGGVKLPNEMDKGKGRRRGEGKGKGKDSWDYVDPKTDTRKPLKGVKPTLEFQGNDPNKPEVQILSDEAEFHEGRIINKKPPARDVAKAKADRRIEAKTMKMDL